MGNQTAKTETETKTETEFFLIGFCFSCVPELILGFRLSFIKNLQFFQFLINFHLRVIIYQSTLVPT